ncbi:MAG: sigma 54-interacting transcriptional regulator [Acidobacteriota bacterium]
MTLSPLARTPSENLRRLCLVGGTGSRRMIFPLQPGPNLVGSDLGNHCVVAIPGVSQHHAVLLRGEDSLEVIDQDSKNGTFVNERRVRYSTLELGDRLWIGPVELVVEEVDRDDAELAVVTTGPRASAADSLPSTAEVWHRGRSRREAWAWAVRLLSAELSGRGEETRDELAAVLAELGVSFFCGVEIRDDGEPVVFFSHGRPDDRVLEWLRRLWHERRAGEVFAHGELGALSLRAGGESHTALLLGGAFDSREAREPLLAALHELLLLARRPEVPPKSKAADRTLRFPASYVRGSDPAIRSLHRQIADLARSKISVLICGDTGVGKEMVAKTLHRSSERAAGPFVAVNCAAIPADLLEAELFGIAHGVATGVTSRSGHFQRADGGTLFLDEIGDMPLALQSKLLRVLEERQVAPLGGAAVAVDLRLLAATNCALESRIEAGEFRRDLYYRIAGSLLWVPSLRQRPADLPLLIVEFLRRFAAESGKVVRGITVAAQRELVRRRWPGNIRQLENEIRRLVQVCPSGQAISLATLGEAPRRAHDKGGDLPTLQIAELEGRAIAEALERCGGNRSQAAKLLGLSRFALLRRLKAEKAG